MTGRFLFSWLAAAMATVIVLVACSGGYSSGVGRGSGMGGTGSLTTVEGNVVTVTARLERSMPNRLFTGLTDFFVTPLKAQTGVPGIQVAGGNQTATTDGMGKFSLVGVDPSANFILTFTLNGGQQINLQIGDVPVGALVRVSDIVLYSSQGTATASDITKEVSSDYNGSDDGSAEDDGSGEEDDASSEEEDDESADDPSTDD